MSRRMQKLNSTGSIFKNKSSGTNVAASASFKNSSQAKLKFHEPYFSSLHNDNKDENQYLSEAKNWSEKRVMNPPKRRSFHTSCVYDNHLYIFGGKDITEGKLGDIMKLNLLEEDSEWIEVKPEKGKILEPLAFHSGTLIGDKYYIIGGNNVFLRQSCNIYIYNLSENILSKIKMEKNDKNDNVVYYLSMHSADYYEQRNEIILFGGYSDGNLINKVFRFNLKNHDTRMQKIEDEENAPEPRIGHASFIFKDSLYIFGGSVEDGNLLNDLWKLDLNNFSWLKIIENNKYNDNELLIPSPRSGHALSHINSEDNFVYIFGGKIGNFQEGNDLWKYDISNNEFKLIHDTILEQYSAEELEEFLKEKNANKKNKESEFHFISKKEQEDRLNPYSKLYLDNKNISKRILFKSISTKELNKNEYENEIFVNPGYHQMKHSSIYNLDNKDINNAIATLDMLLPYKIGEKGIKMPLPRDGSTLQFFQDKLYVFGGDRNKYPFNDLYIFNLK